MYDPLPDLARWHPLIPHPVQMDLITDPHRYKVVAAGRRSGKTERAKRYIVRQALAVPGMYFIAAPTRDQVKRIYWQDIKALTVCGLYPKRPSESELTVYMPNGSTITLVGLDKPQRIEGIPWDGGIIDEIADVKPEAWTENIAPSLDTVHPEYPDRRPWCWLIGVPEGLNHFYDLAQYAMSGASTEWKYYHWKSSEILPADVIEAAKARMSQRQYRQEYEASFEGTSGRIYPDYDQDNTTTRTVQPHEELLWCHDFNYSPLSSAVCVRDGDHLYVVDEVVIESAIARNAAVEFCERYYKHKNKTVTVYGDPSGRAGEKHGQMSNYLDIEKILHDYMWKVTRKVKPAAPAIRDRQNAVRAKVRSAKGDISLWINPKTAPYAHRGLSTVQVKEGSAFIEEETRYQHITTAIGYMVEYEWPVRRDVESKPQIHLGSKNYYGRVHERQR